MANNFNILDTPPVASGDVDPGAERTANKDAASGYMGLSASSCGNSPPKTHDHSAAGDQAGLAVRQTPVRQNVRTAGTVTCSASTGAFADVPSIGDLVFASAFVAVGDWVEVYVSAVPSNEATNFVMDACSVVSAAPVNYWGSTGGASDQGVQAWFVGSAVFQNIGGGVGKAIVAGDLAVDGSLTIRLRYRTVSNTARTILATTANPFHFGARNLGHQL